MVYFCSTIDRIIKIDFYISHFSFNETFVNVKQNIIFPFKLKKIKYYYFQDYNIQNLVLKIQTAR